MLILFSSSLSEIPDHGHTKLNTLSPLLGQFLLLLFCVTYFNYLQLVNPHYIEYFFSGWKKGSSLLFLKRGQWPAGLVCRAANTGCLSLSPLPSPLSCSFYPTHSPFSLCCQTAHKSHVLHWPTDDTFAFCPNHNMWPNGNVILPLT